MQRNEQAPEKRETGDGHHLAVNSIFHTLQGEGPFAGMPAVFVRLAGCNLQCPLCDTEYTKRQYMPLEEIVESINGALPHWPQGRSWALPEPYTVPTRLVVITGGEPFRQPLGRLVMKLRHLGWQVQIETNGTLYQATFPFVDEGVTIVCSPKAGQVHRELLPWVKAWKYVAAHDNINPADGLPTQALEHPNANGLYRPPSGHLAPVYLQPVDAKDADTNRRNLEAVVQSCLEHGHRLCIQLHKITGLD